MSFSYTRKVKYYETDRMGVVHHSNYLRFLEDARVEWVDTLLTPYSELEKMGLIIPFIESYGKFRHFLQFGDEFRVDMKATRYNGIKMTFSYEIYNTETGDLCYTGTTTHYFAKNEPGYRPLSLKRTFPEIHEKIQAIMQSQDEEDNGNVN